MKWFYNLMYGRFRAPWDIGPRAELVQLVESGRLKPGQAIDLGSGTASNVIFLAQHGFDVTGVDYAPAAIELGRRRAQAAGVRVNFLVDDLTRLQHVAGTFDLLIDYGTLDDLSLPDRERYMQNVLPLTKPGSQFLLYCFEWRPVWWERALFKTGFLGNLLLEPGEAERRFGPHFAIERYAGETGQSGWPRGWAAYLMTRKG